MIIFVLNKKFERSDMITDYTSLIWTERWYTNGDFELTLPASDRYFNILPGTVLELAEKNSSPMMIETVRHSKGEDGFDSITFSGRSIEIIADSLYFKNSPVFYGHIEEVATDIMTRATNFDRYNNTFDRLLDLSILKSISAGTKNEGRMYYESNDDSVFKQYTDVLKIRNLGYIIRRLENDPLATWYIATKPTRDNTKVVFSTYMNDFESFSTVRSITSYRNLAVVRYTYNGEEIRYLNVTNPHLQGSTELDREVSRRMTLVDATSIDRADFDNNPDFLAAIRMEGLKALIDNRYVYTFDGKISSENRFTFGTDYELGDIIPVHHQGRTFNSRIVEYIWSASNNTIQGYPTLEFF